jgi:hypothetical protein
MLRSRPPVVALKSCLLSGREPVLIDTNNKRGVSFSLLKASFAKDHSSLFSPQFDRQLAPCFNKVRMLIPSLIDSRGVASRKVSALPQGGRPIFQA